MFDLTTLLTSIPALLETIDSRIKKSKGMARWLLLELKTNIGIIQPFVEDDVNVDKVIKQLEVKQLQKALEAGFNLDSLKRGGVKAETIDNVPQLKVYVDWSTERLFLSIYEKITVLQKIIAIDADNPKIRKQVRLNNILLQMGLLVKHIES